MGANHRAAGLDDLAGSEFVTRALAGLVREGAAPQRQAWALDFTALASKHNGAGGPTNEIAATGGWKLAGMAICYTRRETGESGRGQVPRRLVAATLRPDCRP